MTTWQPTENQKKFVTKLLEERVPANEHANWYHHIKDNASLQRAIETLKAKPVLNFDHEISNLPNLENAYYALKINGEFRFYRVSRPKEGRWAGRIFLAAQASDEFHAIRNFDTAKSILVQIAQDPRRAASDYGREIGQCGRCHRKLTSEWRKVGIGPECSKKEW